MPNKVTHSVVIPVYKNEESIDELVDSLQKLSESIIGVLEVVFVVDGSPDASASKINLRFPNEYMTSQVLQLSRNFGSLSAVRMGLAAAQGDYIAVIAADLQEPPELIRKFFNKLEEGSSDIVMGRRIARHDNFSSALMARIYWGNYKRIINREVPSGGVDVFACTRNVANQLNKLPEGSTSLIGLLFWVGFRREFIDYTRLSRPYGSSSWTLRKRIRYFMDSVFAFTDIPIIALQFVGLFGILASVILGIAIFWVSLTGSLNPPGYAALMTVILASTSGILLGLGVVGSYAWRAYENTKLRPIAIISEHRIFNKKMEDND
ncbi:MAG TPA: glycosyltransferase family 2 protein [Candidatus Paceibacterota bacterium]|nr:glycosyltransferase family 2 protein [Candidatus Paceibacterota bacterium]